MKCSLLHALLCTKQTKEMKVLAYMVRHNMGGVYVTKHGFSGEIAKNIGSTNVGVRELLQVLKRKRLIKFIDNGMGNGLGAYIFHEAVQLLCDQDQDIISFKFITKN